ncbi:hypothetical protein N665_0201s0071 [Sinapis alba]|nr:hypothetical protein N665_0201s0071 [Sinapis alba]
MVRSRKYSLWKFDGGGRANEGTIWWHAPAERMWSTSYEIYPPLFIAISIL